MRRVSWTADWDFISGGLPSLGSCVYGLMAVGVGMSHPGRPFRRQKGSGGTSHQCSCFEVWSSVMIGTKVESGHIKPGYSMLSLEDHRQCSFFLRPLNDCIYSLCFQVCFTLGFFFFLIIKAAYGSL